jgi:hypothetical protein
LMPNEDSAAGGRLLIVRELGLDRTEIRKSEISYDHSDDGTLCVSSRSAGTNRKNRRLARNVINVE